jgi:hypothetical protein
MARQGNAFFGGAPQRGFDLRRARPSANAAMARQHALHVAVENRLARPESKRGNRRGRRAADAGQRGKRRGIARKVAAMRAHDRGGRGVQVMRAPVIAEAAPVREHGVDRGAGQCGDIGERIDKAQVVRRHRRDLRLLQHDLGEPDAIRIARVLPRQIVTAVRALPGDDASSERTRDQFLILLRITEMHDNLHVVPAKAGT